MGAVLMEHRTISDNWTLQNVRELLDHGLQDEEVPVIKIHRDTDSHEYEGIPSAVVAFEALFDLIADIVLRDQIWVDEKFACTWIGRGGQLDALAHESVILPFRFLAQPQELVGPRDEFVSRLCSTSSLRRDHAANVQEWSISSSVPNRYLSQVLWGGAGMLARAVVYDQPYTPHPLRKRLFASAGITLANPDGPARVLQLINDKRAAIRLAHSREDRMLSLQVSLPAFAGEVIRESSSVSDLMKVALQLRAEYTELRAWLNEYQTALRIGDFEDVQRYEKILRSVSRYVDSKIGKDDSGSPSFTVGIDLLKVAVRHDPINQLQNQFGVRCLINNLVFSRSRHGDLQKLLSFFGHRTSPTGLKVTDHFLRKV
jgi:hypothetical protein